MDRTLELDSLLKINNVNYDFKKNKPAFYEEIYNTIANIARSASQTASYKSLLVLEKQLNETIKKNTELLDSIKITGNEDVKKHFEGIKYIINKKIVDTSKQLTSFKNKTTDLEIELEPQKPTSFKNISEDLIFEQENKNIIESSQYDATRQRLLKIEAIQKAIQENLILQDERIDNICKSHSETNTIYNILNNDEMMSAGSIFRRSTTTVIMCLTFVLIFVHMYYRK